MRIVIAAVGIIAAAVLVYLGWVLLRGDRQ